MIAASHAVEVTRNNAGQCQRYDTRDGNQTATFELLDVVDPGILTGIDAQYGRCAKRTHEDRAMFPTTYICSLFLARGDLLSNVEVHTPASVDEARAALLAITPVAVAALVTA